MYCNPLIGSAGVVQELDGREDMQEEITEE